MGNRWAPHPDLATPSPPDSVKDGRMTQGSQSESTPGQRPDPSLTPAKPFPPRQLSRPPVTCSQGPLTISMRCPRRQQPSCHCSCLRSCGSSLKTEMWENGGCAAQHRRTGSLPGVPSGPSGPRGGPLTSLPEPTASSLGSAPQGLPTTPRFRTRFGK